MATKSFGIDMSKFSGLGESAQAVILIIQFFLLSFAEFQNNGDNMKKFEIIIIAVLLLVSCNQDPEKELIFIDPVFS